MEKITSAGRLLAESTRLRTLCRQQPNAYLYQILPKYFEIKGVKYWQSNAFRFAKLVDRVNDDLDILSDARAAKYRDTLEGLKSVIDPVHYTQTGDSTAKKFFGELTFERLENFHENLILSGRSYSIEQERSTIRAASIE